ncbi:MAG TPA: hypothetical protein VG847_01815 [Chitinophagaceae bacterium]|nr:hypothetical protein [Chitinophagaceae bacterium]
MSKRIFYSEHFYEKGPKDTGALEKNVQDYPFSSLANFLLLYHYKKIGHPGFEEQAKKTALLFSNADWLEFQLSSSARENEPAAEKPDGMEENKPVEQATTFTGIYNPDVEKEAIPREEYLVRHVEVSEATRPDFIPGETQQNNFVAASVSEKANDEPALQDPPAQNVLKEEEKLTGENDALSFEPLHTVDYFASQGIQLNEDLIKNDKLVNQVKSFTAWLKTMKKIHPSKLEEQSIADENLIQTSAEVSNIDTEVLTEAMAEVLIKQNKTEKAIEMYTKLSLINPAKSAYFASRIEQIKSTL